MCGVPDKMTLVLFRDMMILFLYLIAGFILVKLGILKSKDSKALSLLIIYLIFPSSVLVAFQTDFSYEIAAGFLLAIVGNLMLYGVNYIVVYGLSRKLNLNVVEKGSAIYTNSVNLLLPLIIMMLGEEYAIYASANLAVQGILMWTHAVSMMKGVREINFKKIFLNINIIVIVIGLILFFGRLRLPDFLNEAASGMGSMLGPTSMMIIGMITAEVKWKEQFSNLRIYLVASLRLLILPCIMLIIFKYSGLSGAVANGEMILYVCMLAAAAPSATMITQFAQIYDRDVDYAVAINIFTTLLCILTMPLFTQLYF